MCLSHCRSCHELVTPCKVAHAISAFATCPGVYLSSGKLSGPAGSVHSLRTSWMKLASEKLASSLPGNMAARTESDECAATSEVEVIVSPSRIGVRIMDSMEFTAADAAPRSMRPAPTLPPKTV